MADGEINIPDIGRARFTVGAGKAVEMAAMEAAIRGHEEIGTEHLLLGLLLEDHGIAAGVLESLGVSPEKLRRAIEYIVPADRQSPISR